MSLEADDKALLLDAFDGFDSIEKLIFLFGLRAVVAKTMTVQEFTEKTDDLFKRHRAGEKLSDADLDAFHPEHVPAR